MVLMVVVISWILVTFQLILGSPELTPKVQAHCCKHCENHVMTLTMMTTNGQKRGPSGQKFEAVCVSFGCRNVAAHET